ncbi:type II toxin-antitoxin system Phd/YefM family antitoxin [Mycolicibacter terrae]|uniref:type II toxin-antitoxin system Phd/YefM family antitoxin n=1 Tax=Mycolicibacter terrae TaxID=1788 RepID=UPI003AF32E22
MPRRSEHDDCPAEALLALCSSNILVQGVTVPISASEARKQLFPLLEQVNTDHQPVRVASRGAICGGLRGTPGGWWRPAPVPRIGHPDKVDC